MVWVQGLGSGFRGLFRVRLGSSCKARPRGLAVTDDACALHAVCAKNGTECKEWDQAAQPLLLLWGPQAWRAWRASGV
jgi:hypothetical protein